MTANLEAARTIHQLRAHKIEDRDRANHVPGLESHVHNLNWLIRELARAAEWARTGDDPGDGYTGGLHGPNEDPRTRTGGKIAA